MSAPLSIRLLLALRWDAARACTAFARMDATPGSAASTATVRPEDVLLRRRPSDGGWGASVKLPVGGTWVGTWSGDDGCGSEIDAFVSLIERTTEEIERRTGTYGDLLERAEGDAHAVAVYRDLVAKGVRWAGEALVRLDEQAECALAAEYMDAAFGRKP